LKDFVVMWCNQGLECVADITTDKYNALIARLKSEEFMPRHNLFHMRLRAQYNPQRHYEIYIVGVDDEITTQDITEMFESNPQTAANIIRERGECFYSDRLDQSNQVIV
jgi:hypothetical protein